MTEREITTPRDIINVAHSLKEFAGDPRVPFGRRRIHEDTWVELAGRTIAETIREGDIKKAEALLSGIQGYSYR